MKRISPMLYDPPANASFKNDGSRIVLNKIVVSVKNTNGGSEPVVHAGAGRNKHLDPVRFVVDKSNSRRIVDQVEPASRCGTAAAGKTD